MGTWGTGILENDAALDIKGDYEEENDVEVLEKVINNFAQSLESGPDADECAEVLAAIHLWLESNAQVQPELIQNMILSVQYILDKSELKELWEESGEFNAWAKEIGLLMAKLAEKIKPVEG